MSTQRLIALVLLVTVITKCAEAETIEPVNKKCTGDRLVVFSGQIDESILENFSAKLVPCLKKGKQVQLILNSDGGDVVSSFGAYELIRVADTNKRLMVTVHNKVSSAAVMIFLSVPVQNREIGCFGNMILHEPTLSALINANVYALEFELGSLKLKRATYVSIIAQNTNLTEETVSSMMKETTLLTAQDMVRYGFAERIVGCK